MQFDEPSQFAMKCPRTPVQEARPLLPGPWSELVPFGSVSAVHFSGNDQRAGQTGRTNTLIVTGFYTRTCVWHLVGERMRHLLPTIHLAAWTGGPCKSLCQQRLLVRRVLQANALMLSKTPPSGGGGDALARCLCCMLLPRIRTAVAGFSRGHEWAPSPISSCSKVPALDWNTRGHQTKEASKDLCLPVGVFLLAIRDGI
ncbi:unnamed protein product [Polarella glacialis]|uniref:Uncharacterized protein n=1 Tax=Polarella glacialis TaxID=89957 RepID=A0A813FLD2_POLGL|nr:unnamed protein product [Polarella glacialis]